MQSRGASVVVWGAAKVTPVIIVGALVVASFGNTSILLPFRHDAVGFSCIAAGEHASFLTQIATIVAVAIMADGPLILATP